MGRCGYILTSSIDFLLFRRRTNLWSRRSYVIHEKSRRYFIEPNLRYYRSSLGRTPSTIWRGAETFFDCAYRRDRLRRLRPFLRRRLELKSSYRASLWIRRIALRLDYLSDAELSEKMWIHMAADFDDFWSQVPLFATEFSPFAQDLLKHFCKFAEREKIGG